MTNQYGHIQRVTRLFDGKETTFRSKLEARWSVYCEIRIESGFILEAHYEATPLTLTMFTGNRKRYLPDFTIVYPDGHEELEECKGKFTGGMFTKMKMAAEQQDRPITMIFANLTDCKSGRTQYNRAKRLEPHVERIIYDANKTIFNPIEGFFDF